MLKSDSTPSLSTRLTNGRSASDEAKKSGHTVVVEALVEAERTMNGQLSLGVNLIIDKLDN